MPLIASERLELTKIDEAFKRIWTKQSHSKELFFKRATGTK